MKKLMFILAMASCLSALATTRVIEQDWDIVRTPLVPDNMWFLQAESVQLDMTFDVDGTPYQFTNENTVLLWEISEGEDYTTLAALGTGTVVNATNGIIRLTLTPEQSNLTNQTYNGYVVAVDYDGTNITDRLVLARQKIIVGWSPYGAELGSVAVVSPYYTKTESDAMTNLLWAGIDLKLDITEFTSFTSSYHTATQDIYTAIDGATDTNAAHSVVINGITNSATANVIDIGTVSTAVTNVSITSANEVAIYREYAETVTATGSDLPSANAIYTNTNYQVLTNAIYQSGTHEMWYDIDNGWWIISTNSLRFYDDAEYYNTSDTDPWTGTWLGYDALVTGPTVTQTSTNEIQIADLQTLQELSDIVLPVVDTYVKTILVTNCGTATANGIYTNTSNATGISAVYESASNTVWWSADYWLLNESDDVVDGNELYFDNGDVSDPWVSGIWFEGDGDTPTPFVSIASYGNVNDVRLDTLEAEDKVDEISGSASNLTLVGSITVDGDEYTATQVSTVISDELAQYGAAGHLQNPVTNSLTQAGGWTPLTDCTFDIPFVSGFTFVSNAIVRYTNGPRWFSLSGSVGLQSTVTQTHSVEVGIATNGVYVDGSTSGPRDFDTTGQKGSVSFRVPIYLTSNDTVGLVLKINARDEDIIVNTWQSEASRF